MTCSKLPTTLCLMGGLAWAPSALSAQDESRFVPSGLLMAETEQTLPLSPQKVLALDDAAYVIGTGEDGPQILLLNGASLEIAAARPLEIQVGDAILSSDKQLLYVIGKSNDGLTQLLVFDRALTPIGAMTSPVSLAYPALSLAEEDMLLAGGVATAAVNGGILAIDLADPAAPKPVPDLMPDTYNLSGIAGVWLDEVADRTPTLFVSTAELPTLVALEVGPKGVVELAKLDFNDGTLEQEPLIVLSNTSSRECLNIGNLTAFLVASNVNQSLFLAVFDPNFKSLDVISRTQSSLPLTDRSPPEHYFESRALKQTGLLSSSCDMGVIWIGNIKSTEVEQFAVNPDKTNLEKIGSIPLGRSPSGLAISPSGRTAYTISALARSITRFSSGSNEVVGSENVRALQRLLNELGYSVGAIDGQIGAKTLRAVSRFEEQKGMDLNIETNLDDAIEILETAIPE